VTIQQIQQYIKYKIELNAYIYTKIKTHFRGCLCAVPARKAVKDVVNASKRDSNALLCVNAVARTALCETQTLCRNYIRQSYTPV